MRRLSLTTGQVRQLVQRRMLSGLLVLVPAAITFVVLRALFRLLTSFAAPLMELAFDERVPDLLVRLVSLVVLAMLVFLAGLFATNVLGRRIIAAGEQFVLRVPVVKTVYATVKSVADAISTAGRGSYQSVVVVEFPRRGLRALGFVSGTLRDREGRTYQKVFIPTAPNPTSGFFQIVPDADVYRTDMTVEEGIRMIVSGGLLGPDTIVMSPAPSDGVQGGRSGAS